MRQSTLLCTRRIPLVTSTSGVTKTLDLPFVGGGRFREKPTSSQQWKLTFLSTPSLRSRRLLLLQLLRLLLRRQWTRDSPFKNLRLYPCLFELLDDRSKGRNTWFRRRRRRGWMRVREGGTGGEWRGRHSYSVVMDSRWLLNREVQLM